MKLFTHSKQLVPATLLAIFCCVQVCSADQLTYSASKDAFLRRGAQNTNEGANKNLNVRRGGKRRVLVAFDLSNLNASIPSGETIVSAALKFYVTHNGNNWGKKGQPVSTHMLLADWTEGNGINIRFNLGESDTDTENDVKKNRGSGSGVTWNCPTDTNIKNGKHDCAKTDRWNGGSYNVTASDTLTIKKTTAGEVQFNVTNDVKKFSSNTFPNYGWVVKRANYRNAGSIWFASKEASAHQPSLIVKTGYGFDLTGAEQVPPVTTTATGSCTAVLSNDETSLEISCSHTVQNPTAAHVHQGASGANGSIICDLGNGTSPVAATCPMTAGDVTNLRAGLLYVNVHSAANTNGELRGQIDNVN